MDSTCLLTTLSQYQYSFHKYLRDPTSVVAYPVFDSFEYESRRVVGVIVSGIYRRIQFRNVLPSTARGLYPCILNSFNQSMSFRIGGETVVYLWARMISTIPPTTISRNAQISTPTLQVPRARKRGPTLPSSYVNTVATNCVCTLRMKSRTNSRTLTPLSFVLFLMIASWHVASEPS